jgi:hypothetical protein
LREGPAGVGFVGGPAEVAYNVGSLACAGFARQPSAKRERNAVVHWDLQELRGIMG